MLKTLSALKTIPKLIITAITTANSPFWNKLHI